MTVYTDAAIAAILLGGGTIYLLYKNEAMADRQWMRSASVIILMLFMLVAAFAIMNSPISASSGVISINNASGILNLSGTGCISIATNATTGNITANGTGCGGTGGNGSIPYLLITITNSQSSNEPLNYSQFLNFSAAKYSAVEAGDLGNLRFYNGNTLLDSWCESGCTNSSKATVFWIKLPYAIPSHSNTIVNMTFQLATSGNYEYNGNTAGIAPQLTCNNPNNTITGCAAGQYAKYDNGNSIFTFYSNFAGTTLNPNQWLTFNSGPTGGITVNNGILLKSNPSSGIENYIGENVISYNDPIVLDYYGWQDAPSNLGSNIYYWAEQTKTTGGYFTGAADYFWNQQNIGTVDSLQKGSSGFGTVLFYLSTYSNNYENLSAYSIYVSPTGTNVMLQENYQSLFQTTTANNIYKAGYFGIGIGGAGGSGMGQYVQWFRERVYPTGGVMPSTSFGVCIYSQPCSPALSGTGIIGTIPIWTGSTVLGSSAMNQTLNGSVEQINIDGYLTASYLFTGPVYTSSLKAPNIYTDSITSVLDGDNYLTYDESGNLCVGINGYPYTTTNLCFYASNNSATLASNLSIYNQNLGRQAADIYTNGTINGTNVTVSDAYVAQGSGGITETINIECATLTSGTLTITGGIITATTC